MIIHPFKDKQITLKTEFCGRELIIEAGRMAFLADGAVTVRYGDSMVLGTAVVAHQARDGIDFFPLTIDYEERMYAAGKISGSRFIKREGKASDHATLAARLIDRPIRPLFPKGYRNEVQAIATILAADPQYANDILGMIAISTALCLTGAPFAGPVAGVKVGLIKGELIAFPTNAQLAESQLELTVAGTSDAIMMVEAGANEVDEATMVKALKLAHESMQPAIALQEKLIKELGVSPREYEVLEKDIDLEAQMAEFLRDKLGPAVRHESHWERHQTILNLKEAVFEHFASVHADKYERAHLDAAFESAIKAEVRRSILEEGIRPDKRKNDEIRPLSSEVGVVPRVHGSALFTRGSTQVLNITTLAPPSYAMLIDTMEEDTQKHFLHHYNFPPYSTGEIKFMRSPGRREIGHGALAERALEPVIPAQEDFPYVIRSVSEAITSNGSTSMASVCATTLSLMDAGVPIRKPVSGIAMGLMTDSEDTSKYVVLSDIAGAEDFAGDMDFKVAGTTDGITALQMDIKVKGITPEIMATALSQAKTGRAHILEHMLSILAEPRTELAATAPRISKLKINPDKIREVIGKGGETINKIIAETGAEIDIQDDGLVLISSVDGAGAEAAIAQIKAIVADPEIGTIYEGMVVKTMDFGAFVQIMPGRDGLVHISELADGRVESVTDVVKEGDVIRVKLTGIDERGRLNLSKRAADKEMETGSKGSAE